MPQLRVLDCGAVTSLQDGGRRGFARFGLSASGAMDRLALAAANTLVSNPADKAAIEFGLGGGAFRVENGPARVALAGASCAIDIDGEPVADHRSIMLPEGAALRIGRPREGVFAYLAVAGGFVVEPVMGSISLHQRAALGGIEGRGLRAGDTLPLHGSPSSLRPDAAIDALPLHTDDPIRIVLGPQDASFTQDGLDTLLSGRFVVSNRADRMGYQLDGPKIAHGQAGYNIISDATVTGSIQVPGSGHPIVLLVDRQTTGGYPKIATVVSADLRRVAQRRPGQTLRFEAVDVGTAVRLAREQAAALADLPGRLTPALDAVERLLASNVAGDAANAFDAFDTDP